MNRRAVLAIVALVLAAGGAVWFARRPRGPAYYTGFVEGEERVLRSEVTGRVLEVPYAEGAAVPADGIVARLDEQDIQARLASKQHELDVLDADIRTQEERITLTQMTWQRDVSARRAELEQAEAGSRLAERTYTREEALVRTGISPAQTLDDRRAARDQARSGVERAREMLARSEAEQRTITLAQQELASLHAKRELTTAQLGELRVTETKYTIRAPATPTVVQTQFIWPGELAQPGAAIVSVLDPTDKYVQVYVPVPEVGSFHVGRRVEIELDSRPGQRVPGEVEFVADKATFTPEKIETRSDRLGQVYRAKVRVLQDVERLQPGTEGNVYLLRDGTGPP